MDEYKMRGNPSTYIMMTGSQIPPWYRVAWMEWTVVLVLVFRPSAVERRYCDEGLLNTRC